MRFVYVTFVTSMNLLHSLENEKELMEEEKSYCVPKDARRLEYEVMSVCSFIAGSGSETHCTRDRKHDRETIVMVL